MGYRTNPDVIHQELEDEIVLVHLHTNQIYSLNATGARLWQLLEQGMPLEDVQRTMLAEYEVAAGDLADEIARLLAELRAAGLVFDR